jgi:hypothetical protein
MGSTGVKNKEWLFQARAKAKQRRQWPLLYLHAFKFRYVELFPAKYSDSPFLLLRNSNLQTAKLESCHHFLTVDLKLANLSLFLTVLVDVP